MFTPGTLFEEFGFNYIGPIDGHDLNVLVDTLRNIKGLKGPQFLHIVTKKGQGYKLAEMDPVAYHGVTRFDPANGLVSGKKDGKPSYTQIFGDWLCDMYPLLPILTALIAGQGVLLSRRRGFVLSLAYVQGLALSYTAVGVIAGLTGSLLTVWLQQPLVVLSASALLVLFALSMFDVFSIQLPAALQSRLANRSNRLSGGHFLTVFAMGVLSALIIGPCVAPPLALALGYIGSTGDALFGGVALYIMKMRIISPKPKVTIAR